MGRVKKSSAPWAPGRGRNVNRPIKAEAASSDDHLFAPADECDDVASGACKANDDVDIDDDLTKKPEEAAKAASASASHAPAAEPSAPVADPFAPDADAPPASPPSSIAARVKNRHAAKREMLTATSIVMISCLIILSIAFCTLGTFAVCRVIFSGGFRKKPADGRKKGRSFRPRLSSPIYSISSDSGGGKKTQSFYGSPSPVPDQREYLDVSTARESRRDTLSPPSTRDRSTSKGRISVLHECPFASAPPLHDDASQYSPVKEVFMDVPPQLRRPDRY